MKCRCTYHMFDAFIWSAYHISIWCLSSEMGGGAHRVERFGPSGTMRSFSCAHCECSVVYVVGAARLPAVAVRGGWVGASSAAHQLYNDYI
jgi:hypothetical protein